MPVLDGIQTLKILKSTAATKHIPVLVISAEIDSPKDAELTAHGALALLKKPVAGEDLLRAVRAALED